MTDTVDTASRATSPPMPEPVGSGALFPLSSEGLGGAGSAFGRTRLRTFIALRWFAVCGQALAVLIVGPILGFEFPLGACLGVIAASAWLNVILTLLFRPQRLVHQWEAALQFVFDIAQVSLLVGLTGGLSNPFLFMIVAPVTVAAASLKVEYSVALALFASFCTALMWFVSAPLPHPPGGYFELPEIYALGQFSAVTVSLAFFAASALRVSQDEARLVRALDAAQIVMAREQRLSALGSLAAATAHELGTPLATIHLAAKELAHDFETNDPRREDVVLIAEQAERCRAILKQLAQEREAGDILHAQMALPALLQEATAPHKGGIVSVRVSHRPRDGAEPTPPTLNRSPEIIHAIGAFVENAASFAVSLVEVSAQWSRDTISIEIRDDGPGFAPDVLPKLGEPYVSERGEAQAGGGDMGLGFFIAKTLIEQTGGQITPYNSSNPDYGAVIRVDWKRAELEVTPAL